MNLRELMESRARLINDARSIVETGERENRNLSAEETQRYDRLLADALETKQRIDRTSQIADQAADVEAPESRTRQRDTQAEAEGEHRNDPRGTPEYRAAFGRFLRGGLQALGAAEHRALQSDVDASGGYLVTPTQFVNEFIQAMDNLTYIRQWATRFTVPTAQSLGAPSLEADPADPTWTAEIATGTEDSSMGFGKRELIPHPLAKRIKLSNKLLRQVPNAEALVRARLAYKFSVTQEANFLLGDGAQKPLGVFVASNNGIPTTRDISTGNTATAVTFDGLIETKFALKTQYWDKARWLFHRDVMKTIVKLVDGEGQYLWQPSVQEGQPDRILGIPDFMSEYCPNTMTASQYVGVIGDFSYYWIADALDMQIQRLIELYAETNQVGLIGRMESDGLPVLGEAFARVKLAAG
jgi:HK97 family phage major capsid protein